MCEAYREVGHFALNGKFELAELGRLLEHLLLKSELMTTGSQPAVLYTHSDRVIPAEPHTDYEA